MRTAIKDSYESRDAFFDVSHLQQDLGARTGRAAISVLIFAALKLALALGTTAILARQIPPAEHGLLALAIPAVMMAAGLSEFGLAQAITQRRHVTHRLASALFWVNLSLGLAMGGLVFLIAGPAADFYRTPEAAAVFKALSPYVFLSVLNTQYVALLRRQMRVEAIEASSTVATILAALAAITMAGLGLGIEALITQLLLMQALNFLGLVWATRWLPSGPQSLRHQPLRGALSYGGFLAAERLLNDLARNLILVLIGRIYGVTTAGLFYRADMLAQTPRQRVMSPLSAAFIPALSRLQDDPEGLRRMLRRQISRSNLFVVPIGALFVGLADAIVRILLGPEWGGAAPILSLLGILVVGEPALTCMAWTLVSVGRSRTLFIFRVINTLVILACMIVAVRFDVHMPGVTLVYVLATVLFGLLHLGIWLLQLGIVTRADLRAILVETIGSGLLLLGGAAVLRAMLDLPMFTEAAITLAAVAIASLALALSRADSRADILKLLKLWS